jgi:hypothetical protein
MHNKSPSTLLRTLFAAKVFSKNRRFGMFKKWLKIIYLTLVFANEPLFLISTFCVLSGKNACNSILSNAFARLRSSLTKSIKEMER